MEKQLQVQAERQKEDFQELRANEASKEVTEEQFLKDLYLFMRKRDTPIERIPHLGFKQIDLFVMFKTVNELGGYQQVTSQQLWKQVYNTLGGNPRSTSAATCTRRHYEKLLLPYECHVKGIVMSVVPQHQIKPFHYITYDKNDDCGQGPAKRKMLSIPLHQQNHLPLHSDPHRSIFPLPLHYPHYFPPSHVVLPPHVPMSSAVMAPHRGPVLSAPFPILPPPPPPPPHLKAAPDRGTEPLEHLRSLSEWYKTSSGLVQQPLNLSKKATPRELASAPVSSFSPPSTSKNPKFLNKPSTLYTTLPAGAPRSEGSDAQEAEPDEGGPAFSCPPKATESDAVDVARDSSSPGNGVTSGTDDDVVEVTQTPSSPKTEFAARPKDDRGANLSQNLPRPKEGDMEIEIPLSVFHNWLKLYRSSAMAHRMKEAHLSAQEERAGQRRRPDAFGQGLTFQFNGQNSAEDLRPRNAPSPSAAGSPRLPGYVAPPSGGVPKRPASREAQPFDLTDVSKPPGSRAQNSWDARDKESRAGHARAGLDSGPPRPQADFASRSCADERQRSEAAAASSAMLTVNSNSLLQLTTEEIMKLKKMISSSS